MASCDLCGEISEEAGECTSCGSVFCAMCGDGSARLCARCVESEANSGSSGDFGSMDGLPEEEF